MFVSAAIGGVAPAIRAIDRQVEKPAALANGPGEYVALQITRRWLHIGTIPLGRLLSSAEADESI
jgi:hypothetical protein